MVPTNNLEELFMLQEQFMKQLKIPYPVDLDTHEGQDVVRKVMFFLTQEIYEAAEWMKNKPWRRTVTPLNKTEFKLEVADMLHFFLEFCILIGMKPDELVSLYKTKLRENYDRQRRGY